MSKGLLLTNCLQNFISVGSDIDLVEDLSDLAALVDQERFTVRAHVFFTIHTLFAPNSIGLGDLFVGVGQQVEWKLKLGNELLVRFFVVGRDTENADAFLSVNVIRVTKRASFLCTARRVVLWIKIEHDALALEAGQLNGVAILVSRGKIRCLIAFFEHKSKLWSDCITLI